jgi:cytochrome c-type biogenesis protein CcmF
LTGVGPLLAWRKSTLSNLRYQFLWPVTAAVATAAGLAAVGLRVWTSGLCFALCAFVTTTIVQEFVRGAAVRRASTGTDFLTALIGLVARSRRRYGGYIVHVGIMLIFFGFAGEGYKLDEQLLMKPGQQATVGRFTVRHDAIRVTDDGQKQMITGHFTVFEDGREVAKMYPAKWYFRKHEEQPTSEVAIRRSLSEDLYLVMPAFDLKDQSASLQVVVNPLVNWIWVGFGVMALGTGIALLPERAFGFAVAKLPADTVTTSLLLLLLVMSPILSYAQTETVQAVERSEVRRRLESDVMCMCGCHAPMGSCQMRPNCSHYDQQSAMTNELLGQGKSYDEIRAAFVRQFGSQAVLAAPIDRGFNRLAWLLPYLAGLAGAAALGFAAFRMSARKTSGRAETPRDVDPGIEARLDDELRNLD